MTYEQILELLKTADAGATVRDGNYTYQPRYQSYTAMSPESGGNGVQGSGLIGLDRWDMTDPAKLKTAAEMDINGNVVGYRKDADNTMRDFATFLAGATGIGALGGLMSGAMAGTAGGAAGGLASGAAGSSVTLPTMAELGVAPAAVTPGLLGTLPATQVGAAAAAGGATGGLLGSAAGPGASGVNAMRAGELASYGTNGSLPSSAATALGGAASSSGLLDGNFSNVARLGLSALAAKDAANSKDATSTRDPWGPAQDWMKQNIAAGQDLQKQYTQSPFSDLQKQQYGNWFNQLGQNQDLARALLQSMGQTATGANNYKRKGLLGG